MKKSPPKTSVFGSSPISCNIPLDEEGCRHGALELITSGIEYNYGVVPIPITVMKNGEGPTVFLSSGCHGDEYEGQLVVRHLIHALKLKDINGSLIILPALNYPAVMAGARTSPLDQGNLNRSFPGHPDAGPTGAIAHYITNTLFPMCDAGIDLHTGGRDIDFLPVGFVCATPDMKLFEAVMKMSGCFDTDYIAVCDCGTPPSGIDGAAHGLGMPFLSAELGGGGASATKVIKTGISSVMNLLRHLGVLKGPKVQNAKEHVYLDFISGYEHVTATKDGLFRTFVDVGDPVEAGQLMALLYPLDDAAAAPVEVVSPIEGIVVLRRSINRVIKGNYIFTVARPADGEEIRRIVSESVASQAIP